MTRIFLSLLICGIIFGGCSNSSEKNEPLNNLPESSDRVAVDTSAMQAPASADPGTSAPVSITTTQNNQPVNASATGMNPAHREPGHRCDIAVGAPLNSPPGNPQNPGAAPPVMSMPQQGQTNTGNSSPTTPVNVNPAGSQTNTTSGMNPPHGQPGHDCSVAVGAPLKK
jgi:hypothetical protein